LPTSAVLAAADATPLPCAPRPAKQGSLYRIPLRVDMVATQMRRRIIVRVGWGREPEASHRPRQEVLSDGEGGGCRRHEAGCSARC